MIYKKIDISQAHFYQVDDDCAKALIDWRIESKKGINQRVFDNALKKAQECAQYGLTQEEAIDRWMESGWTGMKWVLEEAKRDAVSTSQSSTRSSSILHDVHNTDWAATPLRAVK